MEKKYAILLEGKKAPQVIEFTAEQDGLDYYYKLIGCEYIDIVHTSLDDTCIVVDDEGLYKQPLEVNVIASMLYGFQIHQQPIIGKAILTGERCSINGAECVGFEKVVADALVSALMTAYEPLLKSMA